MFPLNRSVKPSCVLYNDRVWKSIVEHSVDYRLLFRGISDDAELYKNVFNIVLLLFWEKILSYIYKKYLIIDRHIKYIYTYTGYIYGLNLTTVYFIWTIKLPERKCFVRLFINGVTSWVLDFNKYYQSADWEREKLTINDLIII